MLRATKGEPGAEAIAEAAAKGLLIVRSEQRRSESRKFIAGHGITQNGAWHSRPSFDSWCHDN